MFQWFKHFFQQREIRRRRKEMYPNGRYWRKTSAGGFYDRRSKLDRYLKYRRLRESIRYMIQMHDVSESEIQEQYKKYFSKDQIHELYKKFATQ